MEKDYFEVSWEDMHGLKSSAVPADLVESACPEKILEFDQRKAQEKKPSRKSIPKKVEKRAGMKEIDRKLNELLIDIEQESMVTKSAVIIGGCVPEKTISVEATENSCSNFNALISVETEIIDLMNPSPPVCFRGVSKLQEAKRCNDIIELSESESDVSPEHARKARELRSFLDGMRD